MKNLMICNIVAYLGMVTSWAQSSETLTHFSGVPKEKPVFGLIFENDLFAGTDNNYTNGVRLEWFSASSEDPCSWNTLLGSIIGGTDARASWKKVMGMGDAELLTQQWGVGLTQLIFTPELKSVHPLYNEHPYVGSMCLSLSSIVKSEDRSNVFNVQIGWTGKNSLAKQAQHMIHSWLLMDQWPGWGNQMPGECIFNFNFARQYRLRCLESQSAGGFQTDAMAYWFAQAGTIELQGGGGFMFRFGTNLPNTGFINTARTFLPPTSPFIYRRGYSSNWSLYGYLGAQIKYVGRSLYLDGPVFHEYPTYVDKYPFVATWSFGVGTRYKDFHLDIGWNFETKEYHTQRRIHGVGSIQVKYEF